MKRTFVITGESRALRLPAGRWRISVTTDTLIFVGEYQQYLAAGQGESLTVLDCIAARTRGAGDRGVVTAERM